MRKQVNQGDVQNLRKPWMSPVDIRDYGLGSTNGTQWVTEEKEDTKLGAGSKKGCTWEDLGEECLWEYDLNTLSKILKNL